MGLEDLQHNFLTGRLEDLVKWARTYSMWPATFGLACCAIEMMSVGAADFDLARFGMEVFRASPRQADLMIVAGRVSQKMAPVLRQVYDQMMEPKWVLSMGVCASSGGMFNNYAIVQGVDQIVPVDVYAPGCPPTPETLMHAILTLHEKVRTSDITRRPGRTRVIPGAKGARSLSDDEGGDTDDGRTGRTRRRRAGRPTGPTPSTWARPSATRSSPAAWGSRCDGGGRADRRTSGSQRLGGRQLRVPGRPAQETVFPTRDQYLEVVQGYHDAGFEMCADLCGVDYLTHPGRQLARGRAPRALRGGRQPAVAQPGPPGPDPGARSPRPTRWSRRSSTSTRASRPWSARPSTCSASCSPATPT